MDFQLYCSSPPAFYYFPACMSVCEWQKMGASPPKSLAVLQAVY